MSHRRGWKSLAYAALRAHGDVNAARRGRVGRRIGRRIYGKITGRIAARLFR